MDDLFLVLWMGFALIFIGLVAIAERVNTVCM